MTDCINSQNRPFPRETGRGITEVMTQTQVGEGDSDSELNELRSRLEDFLVPIHKITRSRYHKLRSNRWKSNLSTILEEEKNLIPASADANANDCSINSNEKDSDEYLAELCSEFEKYMVGLTEWYEAGNDKAEDNNASLQTLQKEDKAAADNNLSNKVELIPNSPIKESSCELNQVKCVNDKIKSSDKSCVGEFGSTALCNSKSKGVASYHVPVPPACPPPKCRYIRRNIKIVQPHNNYTVNTPMPRQNAINNKSGLHSVLDRAANNIYDQKSGSLLKERKKKKNRLRAELSTAKDYDLAQIRDSAERVHAKRKEAKDTSNHQIKMLPPIIKSNKKNDVTNNSPKSFRQMHLPCLHIEKRNLVFENGKGKPKGVKLRAVQSKIGPARGRLLLPTKLAFPWQ